MNKILLPHDVPEKVWINPPAKTGGTQDRVQAEKIDSTQNTAVIFKKILPDGGKIKGMGANSSLIDLQRLSHFG